MIIRLFKNYFNFNQKISFIILFIVMLFASLLELVGITLIIPLIDILNNNKNQNYQSNFFLILEKINYLNISPLFNFLLLFTIFFLFKFFFLLFYYYLETKFIGSFKESLSNKFFFRYLMSNYQAKEKNSAELLNTTIIEVDVATNYLNSFSKILLDITIIFFLAIYLLNYNFTVSIISISILLFFLFIYLLFFKDFITVLGEKRLSISNKRSQYLDEGFKGKKIIKILNSENFFYLKFHEYNFLLKKLTIQINFISNLPKIIFELVGVICLLGVFIFAKYISYYDGNIIELLGVYLFAFFRIVPCINRMAGNFQILNFNKLSVLSIIDYKEIENKEYNIDATSIVFKKNILLKFDKFNYPIKDKDITLKNINLFINKNSKIGIIGPSGSGKSTLLDILSGIILVKNDSILVDGNSISGKMNSWRKILSYVPQKTFIIEDTLKNNILFGLNKNLFDDSYFNQILENSNLKDLVDKLPDGTESLIKENGNNLSGGEIQRIGIARALLRTPEILLLDEVTSNLDLDTEEKIINDILKIKNLTIISVSHRLTTFNGFESIYSLNDGNLNKI